MTAYQCDKSGKGCFKTGVTCHSEKRRFDMLLLRWIICRLHNISAMHAQYN
ncbi:hypothetical protein Xmau_03356 [Xenorhabdus mauleonii]|uniref:Uncharacterized protein n=1 Tax=Xenorhabdus mauleonii TaxID=351675 RepID=A0A1I3R0G9_9GAMM|nr:hypothetical protein Xmau_03356 [Xenorhabdus mauleonii]SFJ39838.1 hypothetical protein SAMN05421680_108103 [Xenorhabdus mauleonii]